MTTLLENEAPPAPVPSRGRRAAGWVEPAVALGAFGVLCALVLTRAAALLEPDDYAYRASIVALTHGELLLTGAQYASLRAQLSHLAAPGIAQWHQLAGGRWIGEKNPGYPFFAVPFYWLGALRAAPLFYGGLGCLGLYAGARRWLGRWGGTWAVVLFCTSGAATAFAWRATMPTFTDASLIAGGAGALLWAMLAAERPRGVRTLVGVVASAGLAGAVWIRYTDVVVLVVAAAAIVVMARAARLGVRMAAWWLGTMGVICGAILVFNALVYGSATSTGYAAGEISFSVSAIPSNLREMPAHLVRSMPMALLAAATVIWIVVRLVRRGRHEHDSAPRAAAERDAAVAGWLAAAWGGLWLLYLAYPWTVSQATSLATSIHVIRFYVPVIGVIALLGAWCLQQLPRWAAAAVVVALATLGALSFEGLVGAGAMAPGGGPGGPGPGLPGGGSGGQGGPGPGLPGGAPGAGPPMRGAPATSR